MNSRTGLDQGPVFHFPQRMGIARQRGMPVLFSNAIPMKHTIEKQLSVTVENEPGQIARISELLAESDVHINAVSIAENLQGGHFRFIADDPKSASETLQSNGFEVETESVLTVRLNDSRGRLADITLALAQAGINIDYVYASVDQAGSSTRLVLKVENIPMATRILEELEAAA